MPIDCPTHLDPILMQRAERLARQWGQSNVVLSFGARNGGAYFAKWLRFMIMDRMAWHQPNNVYLDAACLKFVEDTKIEVKDASRPWLIGVASMNAGWKEYYRYAVHQSNCMVFVATPEWSDSPYCAMERRYFIYENSNRRRNRKPPLRAIELSIAGHRINIQGATVIKADRMDVETNYHESNVVKHRANSRAAAKFGVKLKSASLPKNENWRGNYTIAGTPLLQLFNQLKR